MSFQDLTERAVEACLNQGVKNVAAQEMAKLVATGAMASIVEYITDRQTEEVDPLEIIMALQKLNAFLVASVVAHAYREEGYAVVSNMLAQEYRKDLLTVLVKAE
jgi:methanogenic corrinoid protein MtbC1